MDVNADPDARPNGTAGIPEHSLTSPLAAEVGKVTLDQQGYESEEEPDDSREPIRRGPIELCREQAEIFKDFVSENISKVTEAQEKKKRVPDNIDNGQTIASLMEEHSKVSILNDPREYQIELFERAKKENTIAVLDTGSGKTLIAVLLIRHILDVELEDRAKSLPCRAVFFMVPTNTLVYQQSAVLRCNLNHAIVSRCGDMKHNDAEKKYWANCLETNMVVVCTPDILHQCLTHGYVEMSQINLLVFDEAHRAKKNASYARIIRDFYVKIQERKPRVFGMTASPVDANTTNLAGAARDLETLLQCKIATYPLADAFKNQAIEIDLTYETLGDEQKTVLHKTLAAEFGEIRLFERLFDTSLYLSAELGLWAADKFWEWALRSSEADRTASLVEQVHSKGHKKKSVEELDAELAQLNRAFEIVSEYDFCPPKANTEDLSSKVLTLFYFLSEYYELDFGTRCIVFVQRKATARLLREIFSSLANRDSRIHFLKPGLMTGQATKAGDGNTSFREQVLTMARFRRGEINCLFATSVAEEGLDVPDCNLVIRFDLYNTMIEYVQSKGRARHKNSKFVDMVEDRNKFHERIQSQVRVQYARLREWIEDLDPSRKICGNDADLDMTDKGKRVWKSKETAAKLTYGSALTVLSQFVASLPTEDRNVNLEPRYYMSTDEESRFYSEVVMPEEAPIRTAMGKPYSKMSIAKRSAAFEMCCQLLIGKWLDQHLKSAFLQEKPRNANARLALSSRKSGKYAMRLKPAMWESGRGSMPEKLYLTIIDVKEGLDRPHQPIGLLTRQALPQFPPFTLFLDSGKVTIVNTVPLSGFPVSEEHAELFTTYTLLLWDHVNAKEFERSSPNMSYWVVPVLSSWNTKALHNPEEHIDWKAIHEVSQNPHFRWVEGMPNHLLENRFVVDPWAGSRRFYSDKVNLTLKPLDAIPEDTVRFSGPMANKKKTILDYSFSLTGQTYNDRFAELTTEQPVLVCSLIQHRQNLLAPPSGKEQGRKIKAYLCPQPMYFSTLSPEIATMFYAFPPIIHRIEDYLIALEACALVDVQVSPALALEAVTKDSDNSDNHSASEIINFRPGMGKNYERLEFMGDCFLKMATSVCLYVVKPFDNEFDFHIARMLMICNKNLFNTAMGLDLTSYVRSLAFSRRLWYPEGLILLRGRGSGKASGTQVHKHSLGDKSVADVCEALIGAALVEKNDPKTWNPDNWENAIKAVTKLVANEKYPTAEHTMASWNDYVNAYTKPAWERAGATAPQRDLVEKVAKKDHYCFKSPRLLRCAFCHPSQPYSWETIPSYQRLEFLGDGLLDMACITHLFYNFPDKDPQWLTEHKMAMVSNKFLGAVCVAIGFHHHLRHNHPKLGGDIMEYVTEVEEAARKAKEMGEVDYWIHVKDPPKCLPDIVEAYIGAIFVDSGFDYSQVQRFFTTHILPFFVDMSIYDTFANNHPITRLHHTLSQIYGCRAYQLLCQEAHPKFIGGKPRSMAGLVIHKEVIAAVVGESHRYAKERASTKANNELMGLTLAEFKEKFGCDCPDVQDESAELAEELAELRGSDSVAAWRLDVESALGA